MLQIFLYNIAIAAATLYPLCWQQTQQEQYKATQLVVHDVHGGEGCLSEIGAVGLFGGINIVKTLLLAAPTVFGLTIFCSSPVKVLDSCTDMRCTKKNNNNGGKNKSGGGK